MKRNPRGWIKHSKEHREAYYKSKKYKALCKYAEKNGGGANAIIATPWETNKCDICKRPGQVLFTYHYMGSGKPKKDHIAVHRRCESKVPKGYTFCGCGG